MAHDPSVGRRVRFFTVGMGAAFLGLGVAKLVGLSPHYTFFEELGLPRAMVPIVGAMEVMVGILCVNRSTQSYGALGVILLMGAAALTHVMSGSRLYMLFVNAYFLAAAIWVVRMERPRFLRVTEPSERHT